LSGQLIVIFVVLLAATVAALAIVADTASLDSLRDRADTSARTATETRAALLNQLFSLRMRRAHGFLLSAEVFCVEPYGRRWLQWIDSCVQPLLNEFQNTERARGALLAYRGRRVLKAGAEPAPFEGPQGEWLAAITRRDGMDLYVTRAQDGESSLTVEFDGSDVAPLFEDQTGLGTGGVAFLIDEGGRTLTQVGKSKPGLELQDVAERCRDGADPKMDEQIYFRDRRVVASFRPVTSLRGTCLVAYIDYEDAMAPAAALRRTLITRGIAFVLTAVLLSLIAARHIAAPMRRLAATVRAFQAGDFSQRVPVEGPAEVQGLGRAFAAMANDLAELVSQEQSGRREAEAANRSKDQFLATLSHELRTPLNAVLGWAHALRTGPYDAERVQRAAMAIERSAESQRRLIEDLLDVSGIAAGRVRINLEPTVLADAVDAAIEAVGQRAAEKDVSITTTIEDRTLVVHGDGQRLQQVVWNLVWNAVKFTPAGGSIQVFVRGMGSLAEVTVRDTGVGIDPEFLPHVFGWFRREDRDVRSVDEGLGLGLALVRQLVELHGGSVRAESAGRDLGSTFIVTLPLLQAATAGSSGAGVPARTGAATSLLSVRALVVDDDVGSREAVRVLLEQAGAQVTTVASAAEARRHLRAATTDVLVSDIAMAQESGYSLMETLRAEGLTIPSIALTGYARREDADRAYAAGFDVHLPKPVDPAVLISVVSAMTRKAS
jgi:signal transduction histidine kinase